MAQDNGTAIKVSWQFPKKGKKHTHNILWCIFFLVKDHVPLSLLLKAMEHFYKMSINTDFLKNSNQHFKHWYLKIAFGILLRWTEVCVSALFKMEIRGFYHSSVMAGQYCCLEPDWSVLSLIIRAVGGIVG